MATDQSIAVRCLSRAKQRRLDALFTKNDVGKLNRAEQQELRRLVRETEDIALANARILAADIP